VDEPLELELSDELDCAMTASGRAAAMAMKRMRVFMNATG
jgi:hypothetical protein